MSHAADAVAYAFLAFAAQPQTDPGSEHHAIMRAAFEQVRRAREERLNDEVASRLRGVFQRDTLGEWPRVDEIDCQLSGYVHRPRCLRTPER